MVTVDGRTSAPSDGSKFGYVPSVTQLSRAQGPAIGGTPVTITGTGFKAGATVGFGPNPATGVACGSATQCTATSPAGAGKVDVVVTVDGQTSAASASSHYSYIPSVTAVSPAEGPAGGGTMVTITGTGFKPGATTIAFGEAAATEVSCSRATQCTARSPRGAAGPVDVRVTVDGQTSPISRPADRFTYR